jgi:hypothetical protein
MAASPRRQTRSTREHETRPDPPPHCGTRLVTAPPPRDAKAKAAAPAAGNSEDEERFRLISVTSTSTPSGCTGRDWFVYRIAQGKNEITGYRQGDLKTVRADVEQVVVSLNERRVTKKERSGAKRGRPPAQAAAVTPPKEDDD